MKFRDILISLFIFIIGGLIISFLIYPQSFDSFKNNIKDSLSSSLTSHAIQENTSTKSTQDPLVTKCLKSFNECKRVTETKYDSISINIIQARKFGERKSAEEFFNTWKGYLQVFDSNFLFSEDKEEYPLVLIATKTKAEEENPIVAVCNEKGELLRYSKMLLLCG